LLGFVFQVTQGAALIAVAATTLSCVCAGHLR
jgi:hypothetical protein